ncbi:MULTISPECIES: SGNH/GDSL hydrolase family protein [Arthrospira]|uniref:Esterase n=1 Tax=Limnospira platensis NIES-46 TaxID=1236695 RepID=A0A5M3TBU6_LIMPL|nr:SGNH/GDSL hydrolase family protein [Arthrospira platensis]AMW31809.1 esterase [Arthrospira platensis YZ]MBD2669978.1 SGNH/GDSL hydrolase family protein [Arthrospira platensis FACHB-439]MBD2710453.1 SGNH/GDSL hydrolase family protein [Arthrospira platensis FACHB-835]MDF2207328.1 SGNH/GDSL hydrolase family protein [Arthrospira platensis NCB002]MDT9183082.1 SGNH/GDSL hydrolase family protein [Limnospira sp. PMC 289.06]MDT9295428.1 SGNH/GDSL hydrolase family protein [Arthrospira platensis PCC 
MKSIYKSISLTTSIISAIAISIITETSAIAATFNFSQIYTFGDSLSDTGNAYKATSGAIFQGLPYFEQRASNGLLWVDYLASEFGLNPTTLIDPDSPIDGVNFAFNGATTGDFNAWIFTRLINSITGIYCPFINVRSIRESDALYILWAGANDYLGGRETDVNIPVNNITQAVSSLYGVGARNFLVLNLPQLGKTPIAQFNPFDPVDPFNSFNPAALNSLSIQHNQALQQGILGLNQSLSNAHISFFDVGSLFDNAIANPQEFGLTNVTDSCLSLRSGTICQNPHEYLFWDYIHPTTTAHQIIASGVYHQMQTEYNKKSVPEPSATVALIV